MIVFAASHDPTIDTCRVTVPELDVLADDWLAGVNVDDLHVNLNEHASLAFSHAVTDILSGDVCNTLVLAQFGKHCRHAIETFGYLWLQHARGVVAKDGVLVNTEVDAGDV